MEPWRLYFAYGSNLSLAQMLNRCPDAQPVAPFVLRHHRLAFVGERTSRWGCGGVATVLPQTAARVCGALYRLSPGDEATLDRYEGVADGHYVKELSLFTTLGESVLTYVASATAGTENQPNEKYLAVIRQGFLDWKLPVEMLAGIRTYPFE
jgi:hypothetical protein